MHAIYVEVNDNMRVERVTKILNIIGGGLAGSEAAWQAAEFHAGSLIMQCGDLHKVPAGTALAVDRDAFSDEVTKRLEAHPNIEIIREEVSGLLFL